jgi:hypothetical protein
LKCSPAEGDQVDENDLPIYERARTKESTTPPNNKNTETPANKERTAAKLRRIFAFFFAAAVTGASLVTVGAFEPEPQRTCADGWHSPSIGLRGACSHHGGVKPKKYNRFYQWAGSIFAGLATLGLLIR